MRFLFSPWLALHPTVVLAWRLPSATHSSIISPLHRSRYSEVYPLRYGWSAGMPQRESVVHHPRTTGAARVEMTMKRVSDPERYRQAITNTALAVGGAAAFGAGIQQFMGNDLSLQFVAGYLIEMSLSVDNLFVFLLIFRYFKVPAEYENRVLSWGIIGAVVMRAVFIALGEAALSVFQPVLLGFAGVLIFSSYKLLTEGDEDGEDDLSGNQVIKLSSKLLDAVEEYDGNRFFTMVDGIRRATPLLLVVLCLEISDIIFAVDSIPAVFGISKDPFIVYTSNIWAILNLRSLFTLLSSAMEDLPFLRPAVAIVLGFVGAKLGAEFFGFDVSTVTSLGVICALLAGGIGLSLVDRQQRRA
ncbi:unnamed protein product [Discosporangium mesarthrocarpum]